MHPRLPMRAIGVGNVRDMPLGEAATISPHIPASTAASKPAAHVEDAMDTLLSHTLVHSVEVGLGDALSVSVGVGGRRACGPCRVSGQPWCRPRPNRAGPGVPFRSEAGPSRVSGVQGGGEVSGGDVVYVAGDAELW